MVKKLLALSSIVGLLMTGVIAFADVSGEIQNSVSTTGVAGFCSPGSLSWGNMEGGDEIIKDNGTVGAIYCTNESVGYTIKWSFKSENFTGVPGVLSLVSSITPSTNQFQMTLLDNPDLTYSLQNDIILTNSYILNDSPYSPTESLRMDVKLKMGDPITLFGSFTNKIYALGVPTPQ